MPDGRVRERCSAASENQKLDNYLDFFLIFLNCDRSQLGAYIEYPEDQKVIDKGSGIRLFSLKYSGRET